MNRNLTTKIDFPFSLLTILKVMAGCIIYALSIDVFYTPAKLLGGGVTGISQILSFQFGFSTSLLIVIINIPLFILAVIFVDKEFIVSSLTGMLFLSLFMELFSGISIPFSSELTAVALGGALNGLGLGIIYRSGASLGGTDIISKIIQRYYSGNMAYTGLVINMVVVGISAMIYGLDQAVLTLCATYVSSQVNTYIIDGIDHRRALSIITDKPEEISQVIHDCSGHGATIIEGKGSHTNTQRYFVYSVIAKRQLSKVKRAIKETDPDAFFTITRVTGVYGHGFIPLQEVNHPQTKDLWASYEV